MRSGALRFFLVLAVFFLIWLALRFLLPLVFPFLLGTLLALSAEPMVSFLHKRFRIPRALSSGIGVGMAFSLLSMALLLLGAVLLRELKNLAGVLPDLEQTAKTGFSLAEDWLLQLAARSPEGLQPILQQNVRRFFSDGAALLDRIVGYFLGLAGGLLSHVPDSALILGTGVISAFLISAKLPKLRRLLARSFSRETLQFLQRARERICRVLGGWLTAQCKLVGVSFLVLFLGLVILKIPYALPWALGICLVDAFPVLGTGTVLLPWSLLCLLRGDGGRALGLVSLYAAVSLTRSLLEPKFLGRHLGLDPLLALFALYAGFRLWGLGGMILAPVLTVILLPLFQEGRAEPS